MARVFGVVIVLIGCSSPRSDSPSTDVSPVDGDHHCRLATEFASAGRCLAAGEQLAHCIGPRAAGARAQAEKLCPPGAHAPPSAPAPPPTASPLPPPVDGPTWPGPPSSAGPSPEPDPPRPVPLPSPSARPPPYVLPSSLPPLPPMPGMPSPAEPL